MNRRLSLLIPAYLILLCNQPRTAFADWARFTILPAGITGSANGAALNLQDNFNIQLYSREDGGLTYWSIYSQFTPNNHSDEWIAGRSAVFTTFAGDLGPFSSFIDTDGSTEPYPMGLVLDGFQMSRLEREPVRVTIVGPETVIQIGFPMADFSRDGCVGVQDIFDFVAAYLADDPRADCDGNHQVEAEDIFDFLAAWFVTAG